MKKTIKTKAQIGKEIAEAYKYYRELEEGTPAFRNVKNKLKSLSRELEVAKR